MSISGAIHIVRPKLVRGWAYDENNNKPVDVFLFINGVFINRGVANEEVKNPNNRFPRNKVGFKFSLEFSLSNGDIVEVKAGQKERKLLKKTANALKLIRNLPVSEFAVRGWVDFISPFEIRGWAYDTNSRYKPVGIDLIVNGNCEHSLLAKNKREDLKDKYAHPSGYCGFQFYFKNPLNKGDKLLLEESNKRGRIQSKPIVIKQNVEDRLKVLIIGLFKSGTSILTYRISDAFPHKPAINFELGGNDSLIKYDVHKKNLVNNFVVTKSLFFPEKSDQSKEIFDLYDKVILITRDPRDQFISYFFYVWFHGHKPSPTNFKKAYDRTVLKEKNPGKHPFHKLHEGIVNVRKYYETYYGAMVDKVKEFDDKVFILKYEDFVDGKVEELNKYLGLKITAKAEVPASLKRVARSKKYGSWRDWFTKEDVKFYKPMLSEYLKALNYDPQDWKLNKNNTLDSSLGSEYMLKLFSGE